MPQIAANGAKIAQIDDAREAVSATLSVEEVGLYFDLEARHRACAPFGCVYFTEN